MTTATTIEIGTNVYKPVGNPEGEGKLMLKLEVTAVNKQSFMTNDGSRWTLRGGGGTWAKWGQASRMRAELVWSYAFEGLTVVTLGELAEIRTYAAEAAEAAHKAKMASRIEKGMGAAIKETIEDSGDKFFGLAYGLSTLRRNLTTDEQREDYMAELEYRLSDALREKANLKENMIGIAKNLLSNAERA
jgi:hypothetical protein